ncbi:MAG: transporter [Deltaproteobacteria bacterium RIFOXYA12_FULL_58_15]|nr:MAG: transporter [Deltaproteobacteria bacterium RIFOXYA12_FULL_58_15]OGR11462.1 MAG: transporter [Deltaproteobacteria bacterium RIFOXYB12_FULL_58_9]
MSAEITSPGLIQAVPLDWKRIFFIMLGLGLFAAVYFAPPFSDAVDPDGKRFVLTPEGKAALALFLLAGTWWVTEVVPIGITSIVIGLTQALFLIRPARVAFSDFMDPSVWFIFGSLSIGMVFTKTGLTRRLAYKMLELVGERTSMIYLGCFVMTSALTLVMAHTAVAATVYPLFLAIYGLYQEDGKPTKFGKGLFIGMAFICGAGSIVTLLGSARAAVALGFYNQITGKTITFFELTYYMLPLGATLTFLLWAYFMLYYRPERKTIPGLRDRARKLYASLGPINKNESLALTIVVGVICTLCARSLFPAELSFLDKTAVILVATVLFFVFKIVSLEDLEGTPWNIILLFGGAMSIGFCLWETGAAQWIAVLWLAMFQGAAPMVFILGVAFFVLMMTNLIMNVAAIAIVLPVALKMAEYMGVAHEVVMFACLVTAGMPFLLLVGAAPNAIAYNSKLFTAREFFTCGLLASLMLMVVLAIFVWVVWPIMGMPVLITTGG